MEGDIPRIETEEDVANGERMGVISEEAETDIDKTNRMKDNEAVVDGVDKVNIADKIKAKIVDVRDNVRIPTRYNNLFRSACLSIFNVAGKRRKKKRGKRTKREE